VGIGMGTQADQRFVHSGAELAWRREQWRKAKAGQPFERAQPIK
jgi:hypothetical protein